MNGSYPMPGAYKPETLAEVDQSQKCKKDTQAKEKHKSQENTPSRLDVFSCWFDPEMYGQGDFLPRRARRARRARRYTKGKSQGHRSSSFVPFVVNYSRDE